MNMTKINTQEKILSEEENRYVIFPIQHNEFWKMYKKAESNFCTHSSAQAINQRKQCV